MSCLANSAHISEHANFLRPRRPNEQFFSYDKDGNLTWSPFNTYYGTIHPRPEASDDANAVELALNDGEFFQVWEDIDKSEGRMGKRSAGNLLDYTKAYDHARGRGAQGSVAEIIIMSPAPAREITATAADGSTVVVGHESQWKITGLKGRVRFPNRPATEPATTED